MVPPKILVSKAEPEVFTDDMHEGRSKLTTSILACTLLVVVGLVLGGGLRHVLHHSTIRAQQEQWIELDDEQRLIAMRDLANKSSAGVDAIVSALGHPEPTINSTALLALADIIKTWHRLDAEHAVERMRALILTLRQYVDDFPALGQLAAAELVEQISRSPFSQDVISGTQVTVAANHVLEAGAEVSTRSPWLVDELLVAQQRTEAYPIEDEAAPPNEAAEEQSPASPPTLTFTGHQVPPSSDSVVSILEPPIFSPTEQNVATRRVEPLLVAGHRPQELLVGETNDSGQRREVSPADISDVELMRWLHHAEPARREMARRELALRGYDERARNVAFSAVHPDVNVRRALADQLPQAVGVDAFRWLLLLANDLDPSVRQVARAVLASTNDREVQRLLRESESGFKPSAESIPLEARRLPRSPQ